MEITNFINLATFIRNLLEAEDKRNEGIFSQQVSASPYTVRYMITRPKSAGRMISVARRQPGMTSVALFYVKRVAMNHAKHSYFQSSFILILTLCIQKFSSFILHSFFWSLEYFPINSLISLTSNLPCKII